MTRADGVAAVAPGPRSWIKAVVVCAGCVLVPVGCGLRQEDRVPYTEHKNLHDMRKGLPKPEKDAAILARVSTPVGMYNCPTRRTGGPWPNYYSYTFREVTARPRRRRAPTTPAAIKSMAGPAATPKATTPPTPGRTPPT